MDGIDLLFDAVRVGLQLGSRYGSGKYSLD